MSPLETACPGIHDLQSDSRLKVSRSSEEHAPGGEIKMADRLAVSGARCLLALGWNRFSD